VDVLTSALVTTSGTCRVSKLLLERLHVLRFALVCAGIVRLVVVCQERSVHEVE
jgi:hypothetical protein